MIKLFFSAYFIFLLPYITTTYLISFLVNSGFLANNNNFTSGHITLIVSFSIFFIEQLAVAFFIKKFFFKGIR